MYKLPSGQINLAQLQREVLDKWKIENSFKESVENRDPSKSFVFYDGPPFANGLPHYGHLLTSYIKDSVARFQTMIGNRTERRFGWDCHGLPAEMETEKELKVSGRTNIVKYGIDKFNDACKTSVMKYSKKWEEYINKAGRWVDFNEDYKTMDASYMESVLWGFKELYKKGLVYEDFRVVPYSWKCETPLSNFETKMDNSYRQHTSKACIVKIKLKDDGRLGIQIPAFALIWTTTAWTLPSNLAIAVNKSLQYVLLKHNNEAFLVSKKLASRYEKELGSEIIKEVSGEELLDIKYEPIFSFFKREHNAFRIIEGDFVDEESGTGLVHIAPGFGEDDWLACKNQEIDIVCPVDDSGKFTKDLKPELVNKTERLLFEDVTEHHNDLIRELLEHRKEMHFDLAHLSYEFYKKHFEDFGISPVVVIKRETMEQIGIAGILVTDPKLPFSEENVEIVCFLKKEFQNIGFGSEISMHFAKLLFVKYGYSKAYMLVVKENERAIEVFCGLGFERTEEITDPRTGFVIQKLCLDKNPLKFKYKSLEFDKKDSAYAISKEDQIIGSISLNDGILNFSFNEGLEDAFKEDAARGIINRFAFKDVIFKGEPESFLKNLGFFEVKIENQEKYYKKPSTVLNLEGKQVFDGGEDVINFLKQDEVLVKQEQYLHNYPHCWRTDTPLIYKAVSSWYVEVSKFKNRMVELNKQIHWMPSHIRDGQFGKWLENARDWSITRNRFWGTPVPVWKVVSKETGLEIARVTQNLTPRAFIEKINSKIPSNPPLNLKAAEFYNIEISNRFFPQIKDLEEAVIKGEISGDEECEISYKRNYVFGRILELNDFFNSDIKDLHRPYIDDLRITDFYDETQEIVRVQDVLDCWFESGSMPFAAVHYPFENKEWFEKNNPADFIVEYVAQTRGWFYTLMVLSTAIFDKIPFKNCLCHGVILDENGNKLSKRLKNYPDPLEVFESYGSDAMRFFLLSSNVVSGGDLNISREGIEIRDVVRLVIKPIWNAYSFFAMYANADGLKAEYSISSTNIMDIYILSKLQSFALNVKAYLAQYKFHEACKEIEHFIDTLNNWYIRRSKERFWKEQKDEDKTSAYNTLWTVMLEFSKIIAPILPFTAESLFIHLNSF